MKCAAALSAKGRLLLRARFAGELNHADVIALPDVGLLQYVGMGLGRSRTRRFKIYAAAGRRFARRCLRYLDIPHTTFLGYSSASLEALEHENRAGVMTVLDQIDPGRTEEKIVLSEMERHADWVLRGTATNLNPTLNG